MLTARQVHRWSKSNQQHAFKKYASYGILRYFSDQLIHIHMHIYTYTYTQLAKYTDGLSLISNTLARSVPAMGFLGIFGVICVIITATALYLAERGDFCSEENDFCFGTVTQGQGWYLQVKCVCVCVMYVCVCGK
jgi:hypothetical protein